MAYKIIALLINFGIAIIGGIVPILIWLWFWEHEDKNPEPKKLTFYAFLGGMAAVIGVIPFEDAANHLGFSVVGVYIAWAVIEELAKFGAAIITTLWRAENDEPIDSVMYMIVTALGFAAFENALYILTPLLHGQSALVFTTLDLRFLGATLVHIACSSLIGFALALSYYKSLTTKRIYAVIALLVAIVLHSLFNLSIMLDIRNTGVFTLYAVWLSFIIILLLFEKVKKIKSS